jgi:hypothetical protein
MTENLDPKNINGRLYDQISKLLDQLESKNVTLRERVAALIAVGRVQTIFMGLRKERRDPDLAGSKVRQYSGQFAANAARQRGSAARPAPEPADDEWTDIESDDEPDDEPA